MTIFSKNDDEDDTMVGTKAYCIKYNITESGVCAQCGKRYYDVPVIDGKAQCPDCNKP